MWEVEPDANGAVADEKQCEKSDAADCTTIKSNMLRELQERAMAVRQGQIDEFERNKQERLDAMMQIWVPAVKKRLNDAVDEGCLTPPFAFEYTTGDVNTPYITIWSHVPVNDYGYQMGIVKEMFDAWFAAEPEWTIPILYDNPYMLPPTGCMTIWFDLRDTDQYVVK